MLITNVCQPIVAGGHKHYGYKNETGDEDYANPYRDTRQGAGHVDTSLSGVAECNTLPANRNHH